MPRFFVEETIELSAWRISLTGDDFHHIHDVLRMKAGDELLVCDGAGTELTCQINRFTDHCAELTLLSRKANQTEPPYEAVLYQGLAKGDKMDSIIQKAIELGVGRIIPMICRRSVAVPDAGDMPKRIIRWNRIAAEAAKQCGRGRIPAVGPACAYSEAVQKAAASDIRLIPWEMEKQQSLREALEAWVDRKKQPAVGAEGDEKPENGSIATKKPELAILIGPEGGFTEQEIDLALAAGLQPVTLGRRILRTETAGPAVLAMILYQFNDF
ncbi:MAG: 16S rRNA (uracil(1498)-N(3))-methyltransferase [Clostridiaceae bacterium]|nr:16S rRNA (uracil(1498)-N(3))-methyltransferase [Clostridiaceae bacterium]